MIRTKKRKDTEKQEIVYTKYQLDRLLKKKQKRFCHYYILWYNITQSYKDAYGKQLSDNSAAASGQTLLRNTKIQQYIDYIKEDIAKEVGISKAGLLSELRDIAKADITDIYTGWITLKELNQIKKDRPDVAKAIQEISTKTQKVLINKEPVQIEYVKIKLHDKLKAIAEIFKSMGWYAVEKIDVSGEVISRVDISKYSDAEKKLLLKAARANEHQD